MELSLNEVSNCKQNTSDYTEDILNYLRQRRGTLVKPMQMLYDLTTRVKGREVRRKLRGQLLSNLNQLTRQKKVIRYRRVMMVTQPPRTAQGFIRISEVFV